MPHHSDLATDSVHGPYVRVFADSAARTGDAGPYTPDQSVAGGSANPIRALQLDNLSEYVLADHDPVTWSLFQAGSPGITDPIGAQDGDMLIRQGGIWTRLPKPTLPTNHLRFDGPDAAPYWAPRVLQEFNAADIGAPVLSPGTATLGGWNAIDNPPTIVEPRIRLSWTAFHPNAAEGIMFFPVTLDNPLPDRFIIEVATRIIGPGDFQVGLGFSDISALPAYHSLGWNFGSFGGSLALVRQGGGGPPPTLDMAEAFPPSALGPTNFVKTTVDSVNLGNVLASGPQFDIRAEFLGAPTGVPVNPTTWKQDAAAPGGIGTVSVMDRVPAPKIYMRSDANTNPYDASYTGRNMKNLYLFFNTAVNAAQDFALDIIGFRLLAHPKDQ